MAGSTPTLTSVAFRMGTTSATFAPTNSATEVVAWSRPVQRVVRPKPSPMANADDGKQMTGGVFGKMMALKAETKRELCFPAISPRPSCICAAINLMKHVCAVNR